MDDQWQSQFDYNATTGLPEHQMSCWSKAGFEERSRLFPELLKQLPKITTVLDVGCGPGYYVRLLTKLGYEVKGVDYAPSVIELAQETFPQAKYQVANGYKLPFKDNQFDLVISLGALQCLEKEQLFIKELCRVAKKAIILSTLRSNRPIDDYQQELKRLLSSQSTPARLYHPDYIRAILEQQNFQAQIITKNAKGKVLSDCFFIIGRKEKNNT